MAGDKAGSNQANVGVTFDAQAVAGEPIGGHDVTGWTRVDLALRLGRYVPPP